MSGPRSDADLFLQFTAMIGLAARHSNAEASGRAAAFLYQQTMARLSAVPRRAIEELERKLEPEFLSNLEAFAGPNVKEGKSAALEIAELLYNGDIQIPPQP